MTRISNYLTSFAQVLTDETSQGGGALTGDNFIQKIIPNVWAFLIQLLALIVMIIIFFVFAYKPLRKIISKRQDYIQENISNAEKQNKDAQADRKLAEVELINTRKEADAMIEQAKKQTILEQKAIIEETNKEVIKMKQDAEKDIEQKKLKAQDDVKKEIVNVALLASSELLKRETNSEDNERLVQQFINDMDSEDGNN